MDGKRKVDIHGLISRLPLFAQIDADMATQIADATTEVWLEKGQMLFRQGAPCKGFHVVVYGQIKLGFSANSGHEKVVEILGPLQSFGEAVMFMDKPYPVFASALVETLLLQIPAEPIFRLIDSNPLFARRVMAGLSMRLHGLVQDVEAYTQRSSTQRLIGYLLSQAGDLAADVNTAEIELPTSKQVLASRLNLTPETFSRVLHALADAGLIGVSGKRIALKDIKKLNAYEG